MRLVKLAAAATGLALILGAPVMMAQQPAPAQPAPAEAAPAQPAPGTPPAATPEAAPAATPEGQPAPAPGTPAVTAPPVEAAPAVEQAAHGSETEAAHEGGGHHLKEPAGGWTYAGFFGHYDQNQLQRGYRVYREVCSTCHSMKLMSFRNLGIPGGPFYDAAYPNPNDNPAVKQLATEITISGIDPDSGDVIPVPAKTSDRFPSPYANEAAARAINGGAAPPDLSVIGKARHGGASYIYSLLTGYYAPPAGLTVAPGQHYNAYFAGDTAAAWAGDPREKPPGGFLAMAPPLRQAGLVTYDDGTAASVDQMAQDVAVFLQWASEPKMQTRKQMGIAAIAYLAILSLLVYLSYRRIWRNVEH
jgi:ubiquinol-cytochrome c reductase cytochrome c1 subunit